MIYHFTHYGPEGYKDILERLERLERLMSVLDMFFMVSGILIFVHYRDRITSPQSYADYIVRRFVRIYPLHLITLAFFVVLAVAGKLGVLNIPAVSRYDLSQTPANLLLVQGWSFSKELSLNYVSWSLSAEWFCYLLLPVIVYCFRTSGTPGLVLLLAGYLVFLESLTYSGIMPFSSWMSADTWGAWRAFADFIAGALIASAAMESRLKLKSHWPAWIMMAVAITTMQMKTPPYFSYFLIAIALYLAAICERNAPPSAKWLDVLGPAASVSFGIYMWHPVIETVTYQVLWPRIFQPMGINFYVFLLAPIALTIITEFISYNFFEKWAGRKLEGAIGYRSARTKAAPAE